MKIGKSIQKAIDEHGVGDLESAMLHACNAVDGTAKKIYPVLGSNARFTKLIRDNYAVFGPMALPGINLIDTRFPVIVERPKADGGKPDIADVIYGIHRCCHGHGDELPDGFDLIPDASGPPQITQAIFAEGKVRLSDRVIFGLLAVAVVEPCNLDQTIPANYYLSFGGTDIFVIDEWWGRKDEFLGVLANTQLPMLKLDFQNWTK